jgi:hypothetical protein
VAIGRKWTVNAGEHVIVLDNLAIVLQQPVPDLTGSMKWRQFVFVLQLSVELDLIIE